MDDRHSRQVVLPGFGVEAQARLAASRVLVIGAGGLGSTVIPALAGAGVGTLGIVDDDAVELSNLHRQTIHRTADVGTGKAASAARVVRELDPGIRVIEVTERLTAANAATIFADYDLVVDGSDTFATRYLAVDTAESAGIPLVWGSVSQYRGQAGISWGIGYRDLFPSAPPPDSVLSCEIGGVLPTTVAVIGAVMATEAIKLLTGIGQALIGRVTTYDALTGTFREVEFGADPDALELIPVGTAADATDIPEELSPAELAALLDEVTLLDVREPWEFDIAALPGAILVPLSSLPGAFETLDTTKPVVVYCHHGTRSENARIYLAERGLTASNLVGGIDRWARDVDPSVTRY